MKSKYAHFLVLKFLKHGNKLQRQIIIDSFIGKVTSLLRHPFASLIIDDAYYDFCTAEEKGKIIQEFYGPEFRLFHKGRVGHLEEILKENPDKRNSILKNLKESVEGLTSK